MAESADLLPGVFEALQYQVGRVDERAIEVEQYCFYASRHYKSSVSPFSENEIIIEGASQKQFSVFASRVISLDIEQAKSSIFSTFRALSTESWKVPSLVDTKLTAESIL